MNTKSNLDELLQRYGVKYIFLESGEAAVELKIQEVGMSPIDEANLRATHPRNWCELSWGSGHYNDSFEAAVNDFGKTPGEAIENCLKVFQKMVRDGEERYVEIAAHFRIYSEIVRGA